VCDKNAECQSITEVLQRCGGENLENLQLFDIYEGDQVDKGKKSLAFRLNFRSSEGTLTEEEINPVIEKILSELQKQNIVLRSV